MAILFEVILTKQCNKRCQYCDLDFNNISLSYKHIDLFINFIIKNKVDCKINFFWWEPLLEFDKIKYIINNLDWVLTQYYIWTNWLLLDEKVLSYFKEKNIKIHLSIDNITLWKNLNLETISHYKENIIINFVNDPDYMENSIKLYDIIISYWFKNIAFMPVFSTKKWTKNSLSLLRKTYNYIKSNTKETTLDKFWYFNWVSAEKQFILDIDGYFYSDVDSLLWLQKQYKNIPNETKETINNKTKLISLEDKNLSLNNLITLYNIEDLLKLIFDIPKISGDYLSYKVIDKIIENNATKR